MLNRLRIKVKGHSIGSSSEFSIVCSLEYKNILKEFLDYIKYSHCSALTKAFHFFHLIWKYNNINILLYIIISLTLFSLYSNYLFLIFQNECVYGVLFYNYLLFFSTLTI